MSVYRIYVEKKPKFAVGAQSLLNDIKTALMLPTLKNIRVLNRYDVDNITYEDFKLSINTVLSEPPVDITYDEIPQLKENERVFAVEYLPGQYDQRSDSCEQCIQIVTQKERCRVKNARVYIVEGFISDDEFEKLKTYLINPVESRETSLNTVETLEVKHDIPSTVKVLDGFINLTKAGLEDFINEYGLAMDLDDIAFCQDYFKNTEKRNPTITEIKMIDTYWSDHCRHTTFMTNIKNVNIHTPYINETYQRYLSVKEELGKTDKPVTLMDLATIAAKKLKKEGLLNDLDESEEINACSVKIKVDVDGRDEDWILMFKNETHNHPTEIEPYGGAATCLGGAIRDPLSGRSYVYQAMRITGAANPLVPVDDTIKGKLPQRKICIEAANGYSSYGNQIGLATGHVTEIYHPGYIAKRMELGAVVGAAPAENIRREAPQPDDVVVLLGGKTGRDGCGGATGSSKSHTLDSLEECDAEVQKGNPLEERKIQRLFRKPTVTKMIKRSNDFGAGGVSVAIGELTDGLIINLDAVPQKYEGLDGTEIAISESQERMAIVIAKEDVDKFMGEAKKENLDATVVAVVTEEPRLKMEWQGNTIVDLARDFLNSNGAVKYTDIEVTEPANADLVGYEDTAEGWKSMVSNLNICSQKGLINRFDSTAGANTVLNPLGGVHQLTPTQSMVAKIPVLKGKTNTCSVMGWGYNPYITDKSPYHGAMLAVVESIAKIVAVGGSYKKCWLTFQEYFERTQNNPTRWGKPFSALLGAFHAQLELGCGSVGGKDSMSGTFEDIDVPPTLVSFAVSTASADKVVSPEFKTANSDVILITPNYTENNLPDFSSIKSSFDKVEQLVKQGRAKAIWSVSSGGVAEGIAKMCFGNKIGFQFIEELSERTLFNPCYGSFIVELNDNADKDDCLLGKTTLDYTINTKKCSVNLDDLQQVWEEKLEPIYTSNIETNDKDVEKFSFINKSFSSSTIKVAKPRVLIPVFPGTTCEYESAEAFEKAGAIPEVVIIKNLSVSDVEESINKIENVIKNSQIIMLPGGSSAGDEPDGSAKIITAFFRHPKIQEAVHELLSNRDGLMIGISNGFQALIKLGLVPFGEIVDMTEDSPTLTFNKIARHQATMVNTRIASNKSPWLVACEVNDIHTLPISHGEGRFIASPEMIDSLAKNGQIATQYVDLNGEPTLNIRYNPSSSFAAIEGITSQDGRILGKMSHSERIGDNICKNTAGQNNQYIFESGVKYFAD